MRHLHLNIRSVPSPVAQISYVTLILETLGDQKPLNFHLGYKNSSEEK
jgi:hypothetical protein